MNSKAHFQILLAVLLTVLGFGRIFAWVSGSKNLDNIMFRSGLAPLPIAFSHYTGHEDFVLSGELEFADHENHKLSSLPLTADAFKPLPGSWSKKGVLLITSLYAPRFDEQEVRNVMESLACPLFKDSSKVFLHLKSRKDNQWNYLRTYHCAPISI